MMASLQGFDPLQQLVANDTINRLSVKARGF